MYHKIQLVTHHVLNTSFDKKVFLVLRVVLACVEESSSACVQPEMANPISNPKQILEEISQGLSYLRV